MQHQPKHKFNKARTTNHHTKKPFDPTRYGKLWGGITFELLPEPMYVETGKQPVIGALVIDNKKHEITWAETNRIIEQLYDGQHRHNVAKRLGMLDKGSGTARNIQFTTYDSDGNVTATNIKN